MKRIFVFVTVLGILACTLLSCGGKDYNSLYFVDFLDTNGFTAELSESELLDILAKYTYNGKKITEIANPMTFNGEFISGDGFIDGIDASSELFKYGRSYQSRPSEHKSEYYFWFNTDIRELTLPCKIAFGDSFSGVLSKLGIKTVPTESCTLHENGTDSLIFTEPSAEDNNGELVFTEEKTNEGTTRTVTFVFEKDTQKLISVRISAEKTTN